MFAKWIYFTHPHWVSCSFVDFSLLVFWDLRLLWIMAFDELSSWLIRIECFCIFILGILWEHFSKNIFMILEICSPMWSTSRPNCWKNQLVKKVGGSHLNQSVSNLLSKGTWVIKVSPHPPLAAGKKCRCSLSNLGLMFLGNGSDFCFARFICWIVVGSFHGDGCYTIFIDWCTWLSLYFVSLN